MSQQEEEKEMERELGSKAGDVYNQLRSEQKFCDVFITVDGVEFHTHKNILCDCSSYFRALLANSWDPLQQYEYSVTEVSSEIMQLIMEYTYKHCVNIMEENVQTLLIAADYLVLSDLVNECCTFPKAQLCLENCISIWHFADFYFLQLLREQDFHFILHHFEEMVHVSEEFLYDT